MTTTLFTSSTKFYSFYFVYFLIHIPITILIDSAIALPTWWSVQDTIVSFHIAQNKDFLLIERPIWLQAFVWVELLFQLPFFFWAANEIWNLHVVRKGKKIPVSFTAYVQLRKWMKYYGWNAAATTAVCLVVILAREMPLNEKINLFFVYFPTFVIPLYLAL